MIKIDDDLTVVLRRGEIEDDLTDIWGHVINIDDQLTVVLRREN